MKSFKDIKIAVVGDVILDRFSEGIVTRKSPEANAPVVLWQKEKNILGGAGNVAANIKSLGGIAELFAVVGDDAVAKSIRGILKKSQIAYKFVIDKERATTLKTRIFADNEYLLRLDREIKTPIPKVLRAKFLSQFSKEVSSFDAIAFADYDKGVFSKFLAQAVISLAKKHRIPVIADVKPANISWFRGVTVVTPNVSEAVKMSGTRKLSLTAEHISSKLDSDVVITRGPNGILLYLKDSKEIKLIKGIKVKVKDIVGAGDVASATLSLALATGATLYDSAVFANRAAALSVEKHGTSTVSASEINNLYNHGHIA